MGKSTINVIVKGVPSSQLPCIFRTQMLTVNTDLVPQIASENTKYVVRWIYDLGGRTLRIPRGCILDFDGGQIRNGSIIWNSTKVLNRYKYEILRGITESGERIDL